MVVPGGNVVHESPNDPADWSLEAREGLTLVRSAALTAVTGLAHGFSTRRGLDGDFDLGPAAGRSRLGGRGLR